MKKWLQSNLNNIIVGSFLIPILLVAFVSISHVTTLYSLANPLSWAIYLSVAVEIAALAALAGISAKFGKFIYIPFGIVTLIQFVGNFFYSYSYININSQDFKDWVDMISGLLEPIGVDPTDVVAHRRILAFITGGLIPFIHYFAFPIDRIPKTIDNKPKVKRVDITMLSITLPLLQTGLQAKLASFLRLLQVFFCKLQSHSQSIRFYDCYVNLLFESQTLHYNKVH